MKTVFSSAMRQATQLTCEQNVIEATRLIQRALSGRGHILWPDESSPECSRLIELQAHLAAESSGGFERPRQDAKVASGGLRDAAAERGPTARVRMPLGEVLKLLRQADLPGFGRDSAPFVKSRKAPPLPVPDGAAFRIFAGRRDPFASRCPLTDWTPLWSAGANPLATTARSKTLRVAPKEGRLIR